MEPSTESMCRLWSLPQELIDEIFSLAFPPDPDLKLISERQWKYIERNERREDRTHTIRPFLPPKVESFLASKQFFLAAASAYSRNQSWHENPTNSFLVQEFPLLLHRAHSIAIPQFSHARSLLQLAEVPNIKVITLHLSDEVFNKNDRWYYDDDDDENVTTAWQDEFSDEELKQLPIIKSISKLFYVQRLFYAFEDYCIYARNDEERAIYAKNVKAFKRVLLTTLLRKETKYHTDCYDSLSCFPIYEDSRACGFCSSIHHFDQQMKRDAMYDQREEKEKLVVLKAASLDNWKDTKDMPGTKESIQLLIEHRPEMVAGWILRTREDANKLQRRARRCHRWANLAKHLFS